MGVSTFVMLLSEKFYVESGSELLEATGKLYANGVKVYVQPMRPEDFKLHLESVGLGLDWIDLANAKDIVSIHNISIRHGANRIWLESCVRTPSRNSDSRVRIG